MKRDIIILNIDGNIIKLQQTLIIKLSSAHSSAWLKLNT